MTPDKTPTDAAIESLMALVDNLVAQAREDDRLCYDQYTSQRFNDARDEIRVAIEKWGSPVVAGEVVACLHEWDGFVRTSMPPKYACKKCHAFFDSPPATTPQPTQAQAGAVPLTDEQIRAMLNKHPPEDLCGWSYRMGIDDAELHHGIKGGQHGTE